MNASANTKRVTTISITLTPTEAKALATALGEGLTCIEVALTEIKGLAYDKTRADRLAACRQLEELIAAIGIGLADCPRDE